MTASPTTPILGDDAADAGGPSNVMLLGIDLGTSRSSVVSMTGARKIVESYVGYPKDPVARKMLGADVLYGKHALDHRLSVDLYRPLGRGVIKTEDHEKNLEAVRHLVRRLVELAEPGREQLVYGVVGVPAEASVGNKKAIIEATEGILDAVMIVSEPFSVAYGLERMDQALIVDIGAGTTDLVRMHGTVPTPDDQVSLDVAGDAVDEKLLELIQTEYPDAQVTIHMCKRFKEQYGFVSESNTKIEVEMPVNGKPMVHDITALLKQACNTLVDPIVDAIHKLVASFDPDFQSKLRQNVLLSGGGGLLDGLNKRVEDGMERIGGGVVTVVEDPQFAGAEGALRLALDMPGDYWQQLK
ncbi:MAG: MamK family actin-like protein [Planctomycetota bacterium]